MHARQQLGLRGEQLAAHYLADRGYRILEQRYRNAQGEIDIIASGHKTLVFVEVKSRRSTSYGLPAEAVTYQKQEKIRRVALTYIQNGNHKYQSFRFDVIAIMFDQAGNHRIDHIESAF